MSPAAETLAAPLHPTALDALQNTPVAPLVGQPVAQVLATMGLPTMPQPLALAPPPGLPPLPPLDPVALIKPVTDLFSGFGTGILGAGGAINPQSMLQNVVQALNTAIQGAQLGLQLLESMRGSGTQAAAASGVAAQGNSAAVSAQAAQMHATLGAASVTVATGAAEMAAVAAQLATTEALLAPLAATPGGAAALLAAAMEAAAEAAAITAHTKAQLLMHSATMTQNGSPVQVNGGSTNLSSSSAQSVLQEVISGAEQVVQPLLSAAQQVGAGQVQRLTATPVLAPAKFDALAGAGAGTAAALAAGFGGGFAGGALGAVRSAPLGAWQEGNLTEAAAAEPVSETIAATSVVSEGAVLPPMMMGGGAAMSAVRAGASTSTPEALVNARHSGELVGADPDDIAAPVIGAIPTSPTSPDTPFSL
ncbi:hypothetical protein KO481_28240 [Nocardia sp. NEAU-G5]|uniref:PPE family domain-containing protein n=1 Tax=Nocardia albiluteola TaxID=2842303 RepID=A0ABS6B526_9NOCA|nr:hypothetical protein [Nocardia albiluteola]MBU3065405.1 hypothetical protein [Nocardia albiluteola]